MSSPETHGELVALRQALVMLAAPPAQQRRYAEALREAARAHFDGPGDAPTSPVSGLVEAGRLGANVQAALDALDACVADLYEARGLEAFTHHAVESAPGWTLVRARARAALSLLGGGPPPSRRAPLTTPGDGARRAAESRDP